MSCNPGEVGRRETLSGPGAALPAQCAGRGNGAESRCSRGTISIPAQRDSLQASGLAATPGLREWAERGNNMHATLFNLMLLLWVPMSIINLYCWVMVMFNLENEYAANTFTNGWIFHPEQLNTKGLRYRLVLLIGMPIWGGIGISAFFMHWMN